MGRPDGCVLVGFAARLRFLAWHLCAFHWWSQDGNWNEVLARFILKDQRAIDLHALVERYLHRNNKVLQWC